MFLVNPTLTLNISEETTITELLYSKVFKVSTPDILKVLYNLKESFTKEDATKEIQRTFKYTLEEAKDFFNTLLDNTFIISSQDLELHKEKLEWLERNWNPSLLHYVTSRNIKFKDVGSNEDKLIVDKHYRDLSIQKKPPEINKSYDSIDFIKLPEPNYSNNNDFYKILMKRRTHRKFNDIPFDLKDFSNILHLGTEEARQIRKSAEENIKTDLTAYTQSVFTCNEIYLYIKNVSNIKPGLYHYNIIKHSLTFIDELSEKSAGYYCYGQPEIEHASFIIFISANYEKYMWRYNHERAYRNLLIDVAQLGQSLILSATSFEKKTFLTPALRDSELVEAFKLTKYVEDIRYLVAIGN